MEGMQANPAQIKKYLKQLTNSREQYINYLGQLAYQEYRDGNLPNPKLQEACSTLDEVAGQVTKWEQDLATIEQMKQAARNPRCAYCGVPLSKGAPFCASCGKPATPMAAVPMAAAPAPVPAAATGKACVSCGGSLASDATFCTFCGKPVVADAAPQPPAAPAPPASAPPAPTPAPAPVEPAKAAPASASAPAPAPAPTEDATSGSLTCSTCGKTYDDPDALFCTDCGSKMR